MSLQMASRMDAIVFVPLSQGQVAVIDFDDMERIGRVKWSAFPAGKKQKRFYAMRTLYPSRKTFFMHIAVTGVVGVDHINGDSLDNRKANLRPATPTQQTHAFVLKRLGMTSRFRGVSKTNYGKWIVHIRRPGNGGRSIKTHVGVFHDEEDAARAYDKAAIQYGYFPEALNFK